MGGPSQGGHNPVGVGFNCARVVQTAWWCRAEGRARTLLSIVRTDTVLSVARGPPARFGLSHCQRSPAGFVGRSWPTVGRSTGLVGRGTGPLYCRPMVFVSHNMARMCRPMDQVRRPMHIYRHPMDIVRRPMRFIGFRWGFCGGAGAGCPVFVKGCVPPSRPRFTEAIFGSEKFLHFPALGNCWRADPKKDGIRRRHGGAADREKKQRTSIRS